MIPPREDSRWFRVALGAYGLGVDVAVRAALAPFAGRWSDAAPLLERLGRAGAWDAAPPGAVVVHAVSLGELQAALAFARAWTAVDDAPIVLTVGTDDAWTVARERTRGWAGVGHVHMLPWDRPASVRRWLDHWRPAAVVLVETELWPTLIDACAGRCIPWFVASGRLSRSDAARYRLALPFFRRLLASVSLACVQDEDAARSFRSIGMPADAVRVTGDLKADAVLVPGDVEPSAAHRAPTVLAASVRRDEEAVIVEAWRHVIGRVPTARLVAVPRHVGRVAAIAARARGAGLDVREWDGAAKTLAPGTVTVVGTPGVLAGLYGAASVAILGGSFGRGAHAVFEAVRAGAALVAGPRHGASVGSIAELRVVRGVQEVSDVSPRALADAVVALLADADARAALVDAATAWLRGRAGAAAATVAVIRMRLAETRETAATSTPTTTCRHRT